MFSVQYMRKLYSNLVSVNHISCYSHHHHHHNSFVYNIFNLLIVVCIGLYGIAFMETFSFS